MTVLAPEPPSNLAIGAAMAVAGAFLISAQDVVIKSAGGALPLWQIFALRGVVAAPLICLGAAIALGGMTLLRGSMSPWPFLRALCITFGLFAFYAALPFISLSTAGAGFYLAPIFMALFSARLLNEPVGARGWLGVGLGFAGVLFLLRPGSDSVSAWAVLPMAGAALYALGHVITRAKCRQVSSTALALSYIVVMSGFAAVISIGLAVTPIPPDLAASQPYLLGDWKLPGAAQIAMLAGLGIIVIVISVLLAGAYKIAPPSAVGTFEYTYLAFALVWDIAFFGLVPDATKLIGMAMIVAAGLLVLGRGQR